MNKNFNRGVKIHHNIRVASQPNQGNAFANAKRGYERYVALAKASSSTGDAVEIENYYQHAEHYLRLMREQAVRGYASDGESLR
jgi:hypothetical protein